MLKVLVFEGLDGVGKTTLAKKLSEKWGIEYTHFPIKGEPSAYPKETFVEEMYKEMSHKYLYWNTIIPQYLNQAKYFIVDRWALSTLIYNKLEGRWQRQFLFLLKPLPYTQFHYFLMSDERPETLDYISKCTSLIYQMLKKFKYLKWISERTKIHLLRKGEFYNLDLVEKVLGLGQVDKDEAYPGLAKEL